MDDGVWYYNMNETELAEKQGILKDHLQLNE